MSPRSSDKKSKSGQSAEIDVYVGLLFVSVAALLTGIIFLWLELSKYGFEMAG